MDIATTSIFAQQQALTQQQLGTSMMKMSADNAQKTATILEQAVEGAASADGMRGTQLDITV